MSVAFHAPSAVPRAAGAILQRAGSRQEILATGWACLVSAALCAAFQLWFGLGLLLVAAVYWGAFVWADRNIAWRVPPRQRGFLADIIRALSRGALGCANVAILQVLLISGAIECWLANGEGGKIRGAATVAVATLGLLAFAVLHRRHGFRARRSPPSPMGNIG